MRSSHAIYQAETMSPGDIYRIQQFRLEMIRPGRGVFFVMSQGFGDVVQTLPLLQATCSWAGRQLSAPVYVLLATPQHYELLCQENLAVFPMFVRYEEGSWRSWFKIRTRLLSKIDLIIAAPEMSAAKLAFLKYALGTPYAVGETSFLTRPFLTVSAKRNWTKPWSRALDEIAHHLGIATPLAPPELHLAPQEIEWADAQVKRANITQAQILVGVHCSSAVPQKCWPASSFATLLGLLKKRLSGMSVISFGSHAELPQAQQVRTQAGDCKWLEGAGQWSIRQTMAMLSRCDLFISGDTGLMHIAAALGARTLSIFGPTSVSRRAPQHSGGIAVCPNTPCHPCFKRHWRHCECIRSITPQRAFAAACKILGDIPIRGNKHIEGAFSQCSQ